MKRLLGVLAVVALLGLGPVNAGAVTISGAISFAGNAIFNDTNLNLATMFTTFNHTLVMAVEGDYSPITPFITAVTFTPFTFRPPAASVIPLWTLTSGLNTYSFDATSVVVTGSNDNSITLGGLGLAKITGFDNTIGSWVISGNSAGHTFSFSASSSAPLVPEPATMFMLGTGLVGLAYVVRRRFKK